MGSQAGQGTTVMTHEQADRLPHALTHSALDADSIWHPRDWKRVEDLTQEERERGERWRAWARQHPPKPLRNRYAER